MHTFGQEEEPRLVTDPPGPIAVDIVTQVKMTWVEGNQEGA